MSRGCDLCARIHHREPSLPLYDPRNHMTTHGCVCVCVHVALCLYSPHSRKSAGFHQQISTASPLQSGRANNRFRSSVVDREEGTEQNKTKDKIVERSTCYKLMFFLFFFTFSHKSFPTQQLFKVSKPPVHICGPMSTITKTADDSKQSANGEFPLQHGKCVSKRVCENG